LQIIEKKKINNEMLENIEKKHAKKRPNVPSNVISTFFCCKKTFQKRQYATKRLFARPWPFDCEK